MNMQPEGNVEIHLKELDGVMCGVQLSYQAKREGMAQRKHMRSRKILP